jgi:hypothetical protein
LQTRGASKEAVSYQLTVKKPKAKDFLKKGWQTSHQLALNIDKVTASFPQKLKAES